MLSSSLLHQNEPEITVIINLARIYHEQGKQYRIITPYDAQRSAIERQLELAKIPGDDKCFNVDSFQGKQF
jgi:superfamily I DNA and/or RNA helicase